MNYLEKIEHLKNLGFNGDLTQIENYYQGKSVKLDDENFAKLLDLSQKLCKEYNTILTCIPVEQDEEKKAKLNARKNELIDILFPGHGMIFNMTRGVKVVIGQVDLTGMTSVNANVHFNPYTLVHFGNYALIGSNIVFGNIAKGQGVQQIGKITIGDDNWFCSGVKVASNVEIVDRNVFAMGAVVKQNIDSDGLFIGSPCERKYTITHDYVSSKDSNTYRYDEEIDFIVSRLRAMGFDGDMAEYVKALRGQDYNCLEQTMSQLHDLTHNLSYEFNNPLTTKARKQEILDILFPIRGKNLTIGDGLYVDLLGTTSVGNNVSIGKNAFFAGNITIGNNTTIGNDACLSAIGHELFYKGRHIDNIPGIISEICTIGKIKINDNLSIGNGCLFAPCCEVATDMQDGEIALPNGHISKFEL